MNKFSLKTETNFIVVAIMFIIMMAIAGLGLLMKYVLIPGKDRWAVYGERVNLYFFGLDRHEWGSIHLILGYILIGLLALHIILHWKKILVIYRKLIDSRMIKTISATAFVILSIVLIAFPFAVTPEIKEGNTGRGLHGYYQNTDSPLKEKDIDKSQHKHTASCMRNRTHNFGNAHRNMSLYEISKKYNVPVDHLKEQLNVPLQESDNMKLVWLKKKYNFRMRDVREILRASYD